MDDGRITHPATVIGIHEPLLSTLLVPSAIVRGRILHLKRQPKAAAMTYMHEEPGDLPAYPNRARLNHNPRVAKHRGARPKNNGGERSSCAPARSCSWSCARCGRQGVRKKARPIATAHDQNARRFGTAPRSAANIIGQANKSPQKIFCHVTRSTRTHFSQSCAQPAPCDTQITVCGSRNVIVRSPD